MKSIRVPQILILSLTALFLIGLLAASAAVAGTQITPSFDAGYDQTLIIKSDGSLWACGRNFNGQLGDGTLVNRFQPVRIGSDTWQAAAAGDGFSAGIKTDGSLWAWGDNYYGQLGSGNTSDSYTPAPMIVETGSFSAVAAGDGHLLAIKDDGSLWACGYNSEGELGDGLIAPSNLLKPVPITGSFATIACGEYHSLAVKTDGSLWAWGYNDRSQLGNASVSYAATAPVIVPLAAPVKSLGGGSGFSMAVLQDGSLWGWGSNSNGELDGGVHASTSVPVQLSTGFSTVGAGYEFSLGLKEDGTVYAWGYNDNGQIGNGVKAYAAFLPTSIMTGAVAIDAGWWNSAAMLSDGRLFAWGYNDEGETGTHLSPYVPNPILGQFSACTGGSEYALGIRNGELWSWGWAQNGEGGKGVPMPDPAPAIIGTGSYTAVSGHYYHSLALKDDGSLWSWGQNPYGELGVSGNPVCIPTLATVAISPGFKQIATGFQFSAALKDDGTLYTWGGNAYGKLGLGDSVGRGEPTLVAETGSFDAVACGRDHMLALKTDGSVWAWGRALYGRLGEGTMGEVGKSSPLPVPLTGSFTAVAAGNEQSFAIREDGTLWATGYNAYGMLGNGTTDCSGAFCLIGHDFVSVSAGEYSTYAIKSDGSLWSWGANGYGELGDGTTTERHVPVRAGTGPYSAVWGAWYYGMALEDNGQLCVWGSNQNQIFGHIFNSVLTPALAISLDTTPPNAPVPSIEGQEPSYLPSRTFIWEVPAGGPTGYEWKFEGGTPEALSNRIVVTDVSDKPDGVYIFYARAVDAAGNISDWGTVAFTIDTTEPYAPVPSMPPGSYNHDLTVGLTPASGGGVLFYLTGSYSEPGSGWPVYSTPLVISQTTTLYSFATDNASNMSPVFTGLYIIDKTAPAVPVPDDNVSSPSNDATPTFTWPVVAGSPAGYEYRINQMQSSTTAATSATLATVPDGSWSFAVRSYDAFGNYSAWATHAFTIDTTAPAAPVITQPTSPTANSSVPIYGTAEANSTVKLYDGATLIRTVTANGSGIFSSGGSLTEGSHTITATATDAAGNASGTSASRTVIVDTTAPSWPSLSSPPSPTNNTAVSLTGTAEANSTVKLYDNGFGNLIATTTANGAGAFSFNVTLAEGTHVLEATATDAVGSTGASSGYRTVLVDTTAPDAPVPDDGVSGPNRDNTPNFTWAAVTGAAGYEYRINEMPSTTTAATAGTFSPVDDGDWTFGIRSWDAAGNYSAWATHDFSIDASAPVAPTLSAPTTPTRLTSFILTGAAEPGSTVKLYDRVTGSYNHIATTTAAGAGTFSFKPSGLIAGTHSFSATATDAAGNTSATSAVRNLLIDTSVPAVPAVTSTTHPTYTKWYKSDDPRFSFAGTDTGGAGIAGYAVSCTRLATTIPTTFRSTSTKVYSNLANGTWYFHVRAKDKAGNWGTTRHFKFNIDDYVPIASLSALNFYRTARTPGTWINAKCFEWGTTTVKATLRVKKYGTTTYVKTIWNASAKYATLAGYTSKVFWNGKNASNLLVPRGKYVVELKLTDLAGNIRTVNKVISVL